jgi:hypothetical protein
MNQPWATTAIQRKMTQASTRPRAINLLLMPKSCTYFNHMSKFDVIALVMARVELSIMADSEAAAATKFKEIAKYKMEQEGYSEINFDISSLTPAPQPPSQ